MNENKFCGVNNVDEINGLKFIQSEDGLKINMDTILLAAWAKISNSYSKFLEAGCGTGAISLFLAKKFRDTRIRVTGIDIQSELVRIARVNAVINGFDQVVNFIEGDLRDKRILPYEAFDALVINPPYSSMNAGRESDNISRTTAKLELTCTLDDVGELAFRVLKGRGRLFAIFTSLRLDIFMETMRKYKIIPKRLKLVYPYAKSNSGTFLIECVKNGGEGLSVMPPLTVYNDEGYYTSEIINMYDSLRF